MKTAFLLALCRLAVSRSGALSDVPFDFASSDGRHLLSQSRRLDENVNTYFLTNYALKFQGCHNVQQWNSNSNSESDVRILTKKLVRFRLCPTDQCSSDRTAGCNSKFGDYIVDMDTFLSYYLKSVSMDREDICSQAETQCQKSCGNDDESCLYSCYYQLDLSWCTDAIYQSSSNNNFDVQDYAYCKAINKNGNNNNKNNNNNNHNRDRRLEDNGSGYYYVGPYCAEQGGSIHLGVFTDNTCTTAASSGSSIFSSTMGFSLPYSSQSLVSSRCDSCKSYSGNNNNNNDNDYYQVKQFCSNVYAVSGKCETRMAIEYPNESSCNYIEGIKIVRADGVIRTSTKKKSKAAAVSIGLFTTMSVLLAGYVYYLRTKLGRAQINLAAASQPLT